MAELEEFLLDLLLVAWAAPATSSAALVAMAEPEEMVALEARLRPAL
jgi:hypothetical protein